VTFTYIFRSRFSGQKKTNQGWLVNQNCASQPLKVNLRQSYHM